MKSELKRFGRGFVYAYNGIRLAIREERNVRFHLCAAVYAYLAGVLAGLQAAEYALISLAVFCVIQAELMKRVSQHDTDLLDQLTADKEELEEVKASLDADMTDLDESKALLEEKEEELGVQLNNSEMKIQEYAEDEAAFLERKDELVAARAELQEQLQAIYDSMGSIGDYVGGEFAWPLTGYTYISSGFGWRFGGTDYHTGIDITGAAVNGKTITAANAGQVTYVGYSPNAYGNYLIIDHGGGRSTLYAHCSSVDVSVGDFVVMGESIAKVGSTGWSTGPHLHFEIRIDGQAQDPMSFY